MQNAQELRKLKRTKSLNRPVSVGAKYRKSSTNEDTVELGKPIVSFGSEPILNVEPTIMEDEEDRMLQFNNLKKQRLKEHKKRMEKMFALMKDVPDSKKKKI